MKRCLFVDYDTSREEHITIGPIQRYKNEEVVINPVLDMGVLCESLCVLIKVCHNEGIKNESDSIRDCIKHLKAAFIDETFEGFIPEKRKKDVRK